MLRFLTPLIFILSINLIISVEESRAAPILAVGQGVPSKGIELNGAEKLRLFPYSNGAYSPGATLKPFPKTFDGGVHIALGDTTGDFFPELIVGAGPGSIGPLVKIYTVDQGVITKKPTHTFYAFGPKFKGGVNVATGYFTPDFQADLVFGASKGSSEVKVFNVTTEAAILDFFAFEPKLKGGVNIATGDFNGDFYSDIIVGSGPGGGPHIKVFSGTTGSVLTSAIGDFIPYASSFKGGVKVAVGDVNGDGKLDIITAPGSGTPQIKVFSGVDGSLIKDFLAYDSSFKGGVNVTAGDVNGDAFSDIIVSPLSGKQPIKLFDSKTDTVGASFYPFGKGWAHGGFVYQF